MIGQEQTLLSTTTTTTSHKTFSSEIFRTTSKMRFQVAVLFTLIVAVFAAPVPDTATQTDLVAREAEPVAEPEPGCVGKTQGCMWYVPSMECC
jgi:hypothetical protein